MQFTTDDLALAMATCVPPSETEELMQSCDDAWRWLVAHMPSELHDAFFPKFRLSCPACNYGRPVSVPVFTIPFGGGGPLTTGVAAELVAAAYHAPPVEDVLPGNRCPKCSAVVERRQVLRYGKLLFLGLANKDATALPDVSASLPLLGHRVEVTRGAVFRVVAFVGCHPIRQHYALYELDAGNAECTTFTLYDNGQGCRSRNITLPLPGWHVTHILLQRVATRGCAGTVAGIPAVLTHTSPLKRRRPLPALTKLCPAATSNAHLPDCGNLANSSPSRLPSPAGGSPGDAALETMAKQFEAPDAEMSPKAAAATTITVDSDDDINMDAPDAAGKGHQPLSLAPAAPADGGLAMTTAPGPSDASLLPPPHCPHLNHPPSLPSPLPAEIPDARNSAPHAPSPLSSPAQGINGGPAMPHPVPRRPYGIISLFDGCSSSAATITEAVGYAPSFVIAAENGADIRPIVAECRYSLVPAWGPSQLAAAAFYAADVRQVVATDALLLRQAAALQPGCKVFIIGGSPCQDLTIAGYSGGKLGLAGNRSILLVAWYACEIFGKGNVRILLENAGSMKPHFESFIRTALGLGSYPTLEYDSGKFTHAKRKRKFFYNWHGFSHPSPRAPPCANDWGPAFLSDGSARSLDALLTVRSVGHSGYAVLSQLAYRPNNLLYHYPTFGGKEAFRQ